MFRLRVPSLALAWGHRHSLESTGGGSHPLLRVLLLAGTNIVGVSTALYDIQPRIESGS